MTGNFAGGMARGINEGASVGFNALNLAQNQRRIGLEEERLGLAQNELQQRMRDAARAVTQANYDDAMRKMQEAVNQQNAAETTGQTVRAKQFHEAAQVQHAYASGLSEELGLGPMPPLPLPKAEQEAAAAKLKAEAEQAVEFSPEARAARLSEFEEQQRIELQNQGFRVRYDDEIQPDGSVNKVMYVDHPSDPTQAWSKTVREGGVPTTITGTLPPVAAAAVSREEGHLTQMVDMMADIRAMPDSEKGFVGKTVRGVRQAVGVVEDIAQVFGEQLGGRVTEFAGTMRQTVNQELGRDPATGGVIIEPDALNDPEVAQFRSDILTGDMTKVPIVESLLAYAYARELRPDGRLDAATIKLARKATSLSSGSVEAVNQRLDELTQFFNDRKGIMTRSRTGQVQGEQPPAEEGAAGENGEIPEYGFVNGKLQRVD